MEYRFQVRWTDTTDFRNQSWIAVNRFACMAVQASRALHQDIFRYFPPLLHCLVSAAP